MTDTPTPSTEKGFGYDGWLVIAVMLSLISILAAVVGIGFAVRAVKDSDGAPASVGSSGSKTYEIELGDLYVKPSSIEVAAGSEVIVKVTNKGAMQHDLKLNGDKGTKLAAFLSRPLS